ncbi:MAG: gliding motility-associated C-terminal domain-containing protein, partial [Saprospiraceae bacterium]|nr:gliding motility-associated C-terminal domain-containing protein [Saprospiraceae bacterium]
NGDRINDFFEIPQECFPGEGSTQVNVTIFNQWGDRVFYAENYLNNWDGTYKGQPLPVGTYFFLVEIGTETPPQTGFLLIQR